MRPPAAAPVKATTVTSRWTAVSGGALSEDNKLGIQECASRTIMCAVDERSMISSVLFGQTVQRFEMRIPTPGSKTLSEVVAAWGDTAHRCLGARLPLPRSLRFQLRPLPRGRSFSIRARSKSMIGRFAACQLQPSTKGRESRGTSRTAVIGSHPAGSGWQSTSAVVQDLHDGAFAALPPCAC